MDQNGRIQEELKKHLEKKNFLEDFDSGGGREGQEQIVQELRELYMKIGEQKERMYRVYTKSVRGLLRRNPTAYSSRYRETFGELKKNVLENWKKTWRTGFRQ